MAVGDEVKKRRQQIPLTQAELARQAGITKGYMSQIEAGNAPRPSGDVLYRLAQALGVTVADLLGKKIEPDDPSIPESLLEFSRNADLPIDDFEMLAKIKFRGRQPEHADDWQYIYESIKRSIRG